MSVRRPLVVLITGCSSGIGRALARELARRGHRVFASARRLEAIADLAASGIAALTLDVTDAQAVRAAVATVVDQAGRLDLLISNAGHGLMGPAAELDPAAVREQFDVNVVATVALAREAVPHMVRQGGGRIVTVGSVSGIMTTPFAGAYCASKAALHALTDALRMELAPFGIDVISLQPGGVVSRFGETASGRLAASRPASSLYAPISGFVERRADEGQRGAMDTEDFALRVVDLITRARPPRRIRLGIHSRRLPLLAWLLPGKTLDRILSKRYGLDRLRRTGG